jgi:hypothetical protein
MLVPLAVVGLKELQGLLRRPRLVVTLFLVAAATLATIDLQVRGVVAGRDEVWTFAHLERVVRAIQTRSAPDDRVMALWPGYTYESGRRFFYSMDNHFGLEVSELLTPAQKARYRVTSKEMILKILNARKAPVLVLGAWMNGINSGIGQEDLLVLTRALNENYEVVETIGEVKICLPKQRTP